MSKHVELPSPRELLSRRTSPGPQDGPPVRDRRAHAATLRSQLDLIIATIPKPADGVDPRFVFKVNAMTRLSDANLKNKGLQLLGETSQWGYFVLPSDGSTATFAAALQTYLQTDGGKAFFDVVDSIEPYGPDDRIGAGLSPNLDDVEFPILVDIHLWPANSGPEARQRLVELRAALTNGQEKGSDEQPRFLLVRAQLDRAALDRVLGLSVVERVRTPPTPFLSPTDWSGGELTELLRRPDDRAGIVGIIDDGVLTGHALLDGIIDSFNVPDDRIWAPPTQHGTMVAGLAAYGDFEVALRDGTGLPNPVNVIAARVVEAPTGTGQASYPTDQPEHVVLEAAIRELHIRGARVVNISLSDRDHYSGPHVDMRTEILDRLARELDLVIVVCSGNLPQLPDGRDIHLIHPDHLLEPEGRIAEPSIAASALTVGSIARSDQGAHSDGDSPPDMRGVATTDQVSPFSRAGHGFMSGAIKPDVVHYGGNIVTTSNLSVRTVSGSNRGAGTVSLAMPGPFGAGSGTSFASPRVARIAAVVRAEYPSASANLTRALIGVSAKVPAPHRTPSKATAADKHRDRRLVGYGMPDELRATESARSRVAMIFDGSIAVNTTVIHEIPVPEEFARGKADRVISIALAFDPPTRRLRREYLAAKMKFDLYRAIDLDDLESIMIRQPDDRTKRQSKPKDRRRIKNLIPSEEAVLHSTLQVRRWHAAAANSMDPDDGGTYFLAVTHVAEPWANLAEPEYRRQKYAVVVELDDRTRLTLNVRQRVVDRIDRLRARS